MIVFTEDMMQVNISEFRNNMKHYIRKLKEEDLLITRNGVPVMVVSHPIKEKIQAMKKLKGIVKTDLTYEEIMDGRTYGS